MSPTTKAITKKLERLPSGISVTQAKKDAKSLAESKSISRSEALDQVAFLHGRSKWATLMEQLSKQSVLTYRFNDKPLTISEDKSLLWIVGQPGSGKSSLLTEMAEQLLRNGHKVLMLTKERVDLSHRNCTILNVDDKGFDLSKAYIDGAVVLVDDINRLFNNEFRPSNKYQFTGPDIEQFFRCAKHVVVTSEDLAGARHFNSNIKPSLQLLHLQNFAIRERRFASSLYFLEQDPRFLEAVERLRKDSVSCEFARFDGGDAVEIYSFNNRQSQGASSVT